jgi:hypothetical protein
MPPQGIPGHFLRAAVAAAQADTETGPDMNAAYIDCDEAVRVMRQLWRSTGDELLRLGPRPVPARTFRMIALALIHASDLRTVLGRLVEFASITTGYTRSRLK